MLGQAKPLRTTRFIAQPCRSCTPSLLAVKQRTLLLDTPGVRHLLLGNDLSTLANADIVACRLFACAVISNQTHQIAMLHTGLQGS